MKKIMCKAGFLLLGATALQIPVHAQSVPEITPSLKKMLGGLPIAEAKDQVQGMVGALKKTSCGGNFTGCYMTQSGPLQLYFFTSGTSQQTLLLVVDKSMKMPRLLGEKAQKVMGETSLSAPIISISTTDYELDNIKMPPALQKVVRDNYFNVNTLSFSSGVQLAARASLGGAIKLAMESMGVKGNELTMRAAVVMPIPTDLAGGAGAGAAAADAVAHGNTMTQAGADAMKPEAFVEFQFAPKASLNFGMPQMTLTDATFFLNNSLTFGYKGNAAYKGATNKKVLTQFQTPLTPAGGMDLLDFSFRMSTPANFTMEDAAHVMIAMASPDPRLKKYGGGFIRNIESFKDPLFAMSAPLSAIQLRNPTPAPEYRFGDSSKPFPDDNKYFNLAVLGPLAEGGPLMKAAGDVNILGQKMGWLAASAGMDGLRSETGRALTLKLGPLGKVSFNMAQTTAIGVGMREVGLEGNFAGQKVKVNMLGVVPVPGMSSGSLKPGNMEGTLEIEVNASCVNPFEIKTKMKLQANTDLAKVFEGEGGVNVDPAKIPGCIGKELEAAYNKIAGEYKNLSGYTANAANAELKKISDAAVAAQRAAEAEAQKAAKAAEQEAQRAAEAARKEYENVKNAARDVASKTANAANKAFNDAGNAFKKLGKKKKHKKGPDPLFAASVFDWDYYYDHAPDVVAIPGMDLASHWQIYGLDQGRQGSPEFSAPFYRNRYLDVQQLCSASDLRCVVQHWLDYGIRQGRQGSSGFSVASYLDRYPDLQNTFGKANYEDALDHWINYGEIEGRDARPAVNVQGTLIGMQQVGGGGGVPWDDFAVCQGQHVIGFRIRAGARVDGLQFLYPSGWGAVHGNLGNAPYTHEVVLPAGHYFYEAHSRSGATVDAFGLISSGGVSYGMFGGSGGTFQAYQVPATERLGCMMGRAGSEIDQLTFSRTGPR